MIDPRLLEWIRQELSKGVPADKLRRSLIMKGWKPEDVDGAFSSLSSQPKDPSKILSRNPDGSAGGHFPFYILIILGSIVLLALIYFLFFKGFFLLSSPSTSESSSGSSNSQGVVSNSITCSDISCLINASEHCFASNLTLSGSTIALGVNVTGVSYFQISGGGSTCSLYQKVLNQSLVYTNSTVQSLLDSGMTSDQINQQQKAINSEVSVLIGKSGTCYFTDLANMTKYLEKVRDGNFSGNYTCSSSGCTRSGDWNLADSCNGSLFNDSNYQYTP